MGEPVNALIMPQQGSVLISFQTARITPDECEQIGQALIQAAGQARAAAPLVIPTPEQAARLSQN